MILQTRRGASRNGGIINAKPIFILSLIEMIRRNTYKFNKFYFRDCREMSKKFFGFFNELIDKVIEIS